MGNIISHLGGMLQPIITSVQSIVSSWNWELIELVALGVACVGASSAPWFFIPLGMWAAVCLRIRHES